MTGLKRLVAILAASAGLAAMASPAFAGAFGIREQSTTGLGLSFAGVAAGSGVGSSIFWNPATITDLPGIRSEWDLSVISPSADLKAEPPTPTAAFGNAGDIGLTGGLGSSDSTYQVNDQFWLGLAVTSPDGLSTKTNYNWAGQVYGRSGHIISFDATPTVGYKINDLASVAASPSRFQVRLTRALGVLPNAPGAILDGDNIGVGYTLGATIKPTAWTEIGVGYRSSIHHDLSGDLTTPLSVLPSKAKLNTPDQVTVGRPPARLLAMDLARRLRMGQLEPPQHRAGDGARRAGDGIALAI